MLFRDGLSGELNNKGEDFRIYLRDKSLELSFYFEALSKIESEISEEGRSANDSVEPKEISCSFCGKKQEEVTKVIAGPNAHICNECVELCNAILDDDVQ